MDNYTKLRLKELNDEIQTCNYNDNGNLINIISKMFDLLKDMIYKVE